MIPTAAGICEQMRWDEDGWPLSRTRFAYLASWLLERNGIAMEFVWENHRIMVVLLDFMVFYGSYPPANKYDYEKSPLSLGKPTISVAMFTSYVTNYQRVAMSNGSHIGLGRVGGFFCTPGL